jgi:hypothetical protein
MLSTDADTPWQDMPLGPYGTWTFPVSQLFRLRRGIAEAGPGWGPVPWPRAGPRAQGWSGSVGQAKHMPACVRGLRPDTPGYPGVPRGIPGYRTRTLGRSRVSATSRRSCGSRSEGPAALVQAGPGWGSGPVHRAVALPGLGPEPWPLSPGPEPGPWSGAQACTTLHNQGCRVSVCVGSCRAHG